MEGGIKIKKIPSPLPFPFQHILERGVHSSLHVCNARNRNRSGKVSKKYLSPIAKPMKLQKINPICKISYPGDITADKSRFF